MYVYISTAKITRTVGRLGGGGGRVVERGSILSTVVSKLKQPHISGVFRKRY